MVIYTVSTNNDIVIKVMNIYNSNIKKENNKILKKINKYVNQYKDHNWIIAGDMNVSLKQHTDNDNHSMLLDSIKESINGEIFPTQSHTKEEFYTIERYGRRIIDYVITNMQAVEVKVDHSYQISDHFPLHLDIRLEAPKRKLNWRKYKSKHKRLIEQKCKLIMENSLDMRDTNWTKKSYNLITEHLIDRRLEIKPYKSQHLGMIEKIDEKRLELKKEKNSERKESIRKEVNALVKELESDILEMRIKNIQRIIKSGDKSMRRITYTREKRSEIKQLKCNNEIIFNEKEIVERMNMHFKSIILPKDQNSQPPLGKQKFVDLQGCKESMEQELSSEEIEFLLKKLRDSTPGEDGVRGTTIKWATNETQMLLIQWINKCIKEGINPEAKTATIIPIPKVKTPLESSDYRGIVLLSTLYKMVTSIIQRRLYILVHDRISKTQFGARKNRSTVDANFLFQNLKAISKMTGIELHILGIDIKKAFDSVPMRLVRDSLKFFGVDEATIEKIIDLIDQTPMKTKINETYSEPFMQTSGIKQGDSLSPLIFVLALDFILQQLENLPGFEYTLKYQKIKFSINNMAFMDDTDFVASSQERLVDLWTEFLNLLHSYGMELNEKKTEYWTNSGKQKIELPNVSLEMKPWIRKLGDFEDERGRQRRTVTMERVKAKLESIKAWYFTIEQAVKLINSDVVPIADFLLQQDNSLDAAELVNKMIKNYLAENYRFGFGNVLF